MIYYNIYRYIHIIMYLIASRIPPGRIFCVVGGCVVCFVLCVFPVFSVFVGLVVVLLCCCAAVLLGCCLAVLLACCLANWLEKQKQKHGERRKAQTTKKQPQTGKSNKDRSKIGPGGAKMVLKFGQRSKKKCPKKFTMFLLKFWDLSGVFVGIFWVVFPGFFHLGFQRCKGLQIL